MQKTKRKRPGLILKNKYVSTYFKFLSLIKKKFKDISAEDIANAPIYHFPYKDEPGPVSGKSDDHFKVHTCVPALDEIIRRYESESNGKCIVLE